MYKHVKRQFCQMYHSLEQSVTYSEPRLPMWGWVGAIGFPLYYVVWTYLYPQPYENLALRFVGAGLFLPLILLRYWPKKVRPYLSLYWYFVLLYSLPFFFTFMLLKNNGTPVWGMSTLLALFLMVFVLDWKNLLVHSSLGVGLAWLAYWLTSEPQFTAWEHLPIFAFAMITGVAFNFHSEVAKQERRRAMLAAASTIAHELRTPLLGIKSGAAGLGQHLPALLQTYELAKKNGLSVPPIRKAHLMNMHAVLERIDSEIKYSNVIIDMLLTKARYPLSQPEDYSTQSMAACVQEALRRYPLSEQERALVHWTEDGDFTFLGSQLLMVHVLFNLLKNALYYVAKAGKGHVEIRLEPSPTGSRLVVFDSGSGIPQSVQPWIFEPFYSGTGNGIGTGVGLSFCKETVESFGGYISFRSEPGVFSEFTLTFPVEVE